jgi:ComEC/Rec2-related protein
MRETAVEGEIEAPAGLSKPMLSRPPLVESWLLAHPKPPVPIPPSRLLMPRVATLPKLRQIRTLVLQFKLMLAEEQRFGHVFLFAPVAMGCGTVLWFALPYEPPVWPWILVLLLVGGAAVGSSGSAWRPVLTVCALVLAGMVLAQAENWRRSTIILDSPVTTDIVGIVERRETAGPGRIRYVIELKATANPQLRRPPSQVTMISRSKHEVFEGGTMVAGRARLSPPSGPALPGLHDFAFSAYFAGTGSVGYFYGPPRRVDGRDVEQSTLSRMERWLFALRARIGDRIRATAPGDAGAFAAAIVTDERRAISDDTVDALRVSGLAHIVAISGLNMALAAGIFFVGLRTTLALFPAVAQALAVKKLAATGALLMVTGYYLISGFGVSAQRAFIMMAVMLVAVLLDRPSISLRNVALSALIIMVWSPSEILGPSFQMSFAATVALVAGYAAWARRAQDRQHEPLPFRHPAVTWPLAAWRFLAGLIMTSLIGSLSTAMFSVEHFHRLAMYGLAANLAAMPIISFLVMPAGLVGMLLMPFGLDPPFVLVMAQGLDWVIVIAKHVAGWGGDIVVGEQQFWFLPLGVTGFLLLTLMRTKLRFAGVPLLTAAFILFLQGSSRPPADLLVSEDGTLVLLRSGSSYMTNRTRLPSFIYDQWRYALRLPEPGKPLLLADEEEEGEEKAAKRQVREPEPDGQQGMPPEPEEPPFLRMRGAMLDDRQVKGAEPTEPEETLPRSGTPLPFSAGDMPARSAEEVREPEPDDLHVKPAEPGKLRLPSQEGKVRSATGQARKAKPNELADELQEPGKPLLISRERHEARPPTGQVKEITPNERQEMLPEQATPLLLSPDDQRAQAEGKEVMSSERQVTLPEQAAPLVLSPDDQRAQAKGKEVTSSERQVTLPESPTSPRGDQRTQAKERAREAKSKQRQENLSASALANARQAMAKADATRFICAPRAWCAMRSATGLLIVVVEDGRYAGAACDQAGLVIAPRARFSSCRSARR